MEVPPRSRLKFLLELGGHFHPKILNLLYIYINKFLNQTLHLIFIFDLLKFLIMISELHI